MRIRLCHILALFCLVLTPLAAKPNSTGVSDYVRLRPGPTSLLETAIVTMTGPQGQRLDLVSAVHLADPSYYHQLNSRFQGYQTVLYELILPESMAGQPLPSQLNTGGGALSGIQSTMARSLGLTTQLAGIDYSASNFVHADLTQEGLTRSMEGRQESLLSYFQKAMSSSAKVTDFGVSEAELAQLDLGALMRGETNPRDQRVLKKLLATALTSSDGVMASMEDTAIVAERNKAALAALQRTLARRHRKVAIFYGAAHMPDLEARLRQKGWTPTSTTWLPAWSF